MPTKMKALWFACLMCFEFHQLASGVDHPDGKSQVSHYQDEAGNFQFGYTVSSNDGEHFHKASKDALGRVVGSYGLVENDGRHRVVDYVADHQGFRAHVRSNEPGFADVQSAGVSVQKPSSGVNIPGQHLDFAASDSGVSSSSSPETNYGERLKETASKVTYARPYEEEARRRLPLRRPRLENPQIRRQNQRLDADSDSRSNTYSTQERIEDEDFSNRDESPRVRIPPRYGGRSSAFEVGPRAAPPAVTTLQRSRGRQVLQPPKPLLYNHEIPDHYSRPHHDPIHVPNADTPGYVPVSMSTVHGGFIRSPYVPTSPPPQLDPTRFVGHPSYPNSNLRPGIIPTVPPPPKSAPANPKDLIVRTVAIPNGIQAVRIDPSTGQAYDTPDYPFYDPESKDGPYGRRKQFQGKLNPSQNGRYRPDDYDDFQFPRYGFQPQRLPLQQGYPNSRNSSELGDHARFADDSRDHPLSRPSARDLALISKVFEDIVKEQNGNNLQSDGRQEYNRQQQDYGDFDNFFSNRNNFPASGFYGSTPNDEDFSHFRTDFGSRLPNPNDEDRFENRRIPPLSGYGDRKRNFDYSLFDEPSSVYSRTTLDHRSGSNAPVTTSPTETEDNA